MHCVFVSIVRIIIDLGIKLMMLLTLTNLRNKMNDYIGVEIHCLINASQEFRHVASLELNTISDVLTEIASNIYSFWDCSNKEGIGDADGYDHAAIILSAFNCQTDAELLGLTPDRIDQTVKAGTVKLILTKGI